MSFRSLIFWPHLVCGVAAGIVILIMSATGVLLTYEKQMIAWTDSRRLPAHAADAQPLPVAEVLERAHASLGQVPATIIVNASAADPALLTVGQRRILVDPYTGAVLGDSAPKLRAFFRSVTDWHRWLAMAGEGRALGKAITGWANLVFAFIVLSGMYLWLPRVWAWRHVRAVAWFRGGLRGKARDFNWHHVIGIWSAVPLFLVVISAAPISFPWASNLVYRLAGEQPPAAAPRAPAGSAAAAPRPSAPASLPLDGLDAAWARAVAQADGWRTITVRLPASAQAPFVFTIDRGYAGQPQFRGTLTVPRDSVQSAKWETFDAQTPGRRARSISRFLHTGEVLGLAGQTIAGLVSLGAVFLTWTGLALTWRRFSAWRGRRQARDQQLAA
jgi:uncharacterized iron-regulated membrane protein